MSGIVNNLEIIQLLQSLVVQTNPTRGDLLNYKSRQQKKLTKVHVYRNHAFESIAGLMVPYLDFAGLSVEFTYSAYDDSLSFKELDSKYDLLMLWLDLETYELDANYKFLQERISILERSYPGRILIALSGNQSHEIVCSSPCINLQLETNLQAGEYLSERLKKISGTRLTSAAQIEVARKLGLNHFPALLAEQVKSIVVDLDNTLYSGILGEDEPSNLTLSKGHFDLQSTLVELEKSGILLFMATKNERSDVEELFRARKDFPLKFESFTEIYASWGPKSESVIEASKFSNTALNSMLFIDDNPGEVLNALATLSGIRVILADPTGIDTNKLLADYPGTLSYIKNTKENTFRKADLQANKIRKISASTLDTDSLIKELEVELEFSVNDILNFDRISELSRKTNQYIFAYERYTEARLKEMVSRGTHLIVSISLKDKLSNSGIIAALFFGLEDDRLTLEEAFISCRALGRGLEGDIILGAGRIAVDMLNPQVLAINFMKGPRNEPAYNDYKTWFAKGDGLKLIKNHKFKTGSMSIFVNGERL